MNWPPWSPPPPPADPAADVRPVLSEPRIGSTAFGGDRWVGVDGTEWISDPCGPLRLIPDQPDGAVS